MNISEKEPLHPLGLSVLLAGAATLGYWVYAIVGMVSAATGHGLFSWWMIAGPVLATVATLAWGVFVICYGITRAGAGK